MKSIILRKMNLVASMAEHGLLSSASKLVYLPMYIGKWPPAINWAHVFNVILPLFKGYPEIKVKNLESQ